MRKPALCLLIMLLPALCVGQVLDVTAVGADGHDKQDDTEAIQKAIETAIADGKIGEVFLPAGRYHISKTLVVRHAKSLIIRGQGMSALGPRPKAATNLIWTGPDGGTLMKTVGIGGVVIKNINFVGTHPDEKISKTRAGTLYQSVSQRGWGNMINRMENLGFYHAGIGIAMAEKRGEICNSDILFQFITFRGLDTGFLVRNDQGVDYLFQFVFALQVKKVLHLERGGNLKVDNAQMTNCGVFLQIDGGGRNTGTYLCNNVRIERGDGGRVGRGQALVAHPKWKQANVVFVGYDDCQWAWHLNTTPAREVPLCDIGPGVTVTFQSSIFNSPVASLTGEQDAPARLVIERSDFSYVTPQQALKAGEHGFFKTVDCTTSNKVLLPDLVKWPKPDPVIVTDKTWTPKLPDPVPQKK